jgi:hypothetical protein
MAFALSIIKNHLPSAKKIFVGRRRLWLLAATCPGVI